MMPSLSWEMTIPDAHIAGASLYAMGLFAITFSVTHLASPLPPRWRRIINIVALAFFAHGLWWLPHLSLPATMARPVSPLLAALSQLVGIALFDLAYRLLSAAPRSSQSLVMNYGAQLSGCMGVALTILLGNLSLGIPKALTFDPVVIALVGLFPILLALISVYPIKKPWLATIGVGTLCVGLISAAAQMGSELGLDQGQAVLWSVKPTTAWVIAIVCATVHCSVLFGLAIWKSQLRFVDNLRRALEAIPVGLALYDKHDRLLVWNAAFLSLGGTKPPQLKVGISYTDALKAGMKAALFPPNASDDPEWLDQRIDQHEPGDWIMQSQDGSRWIRLQNRRNGNRGLVTITSDFTEQKKHEAELAAALQEARSANIAKSRFLANMSHEIRTPLNGMVAMTEALSRSELNTKQEEMVGLIRASSDTLQILLSDILDLARIESGQMKITHAPFDLVRLINETQSLYANAANEKNVKFTCHIAPEARTWVMGDEVRTRQILNNLLSNAVKFTGEGQISLTVNRRNSDLLMRVDDTGIGFEAANLRSLFGRFAQADDQITRRFGGSGLGLSICAELADMMGGTVDGTSQPGLGSSFTVSLPLERIASPDPTFGEPAHPRSQPPPPAKPDSAKNLRILLADDNATNRRVVELILDNKQFDLVEAEDGQQALNALEQGRFDLVLMDMQMPVMDGLTATRMIREREASHGLSRIPVIMLTANAMPEHVAASLEAGADAHLAKPFNITRMLELAYALTNKNQPA